MSKEQTLERRAVTALSDDTLTSATAAELIAELTRASAAARQDAAALAEQALDPAKSPDQTVARERRDDAALRVGRLETLLAQLQRRLSIVRELEAVAAYEQKRDELQKESDLREQELIEVYSASADAIITAFERAREFQARAARMLGQLPPQTEPLRPFALAVQQLMENVKLVDFKGEQHWPPPSAQLGVTYAETTPFPSHIRGVASYVGPGWETEEMQERFRVAGERERARQAAHYEELT